MFESVVFEGQGFQASMIIVHALTCAQKLNKHSDAEWLQMIKSAMLMSVIGIALMIWTERIFAHSVILSLHMPMMKKGR
ncbi:hypothetical protein N410_08495 [Helicobacter pylori GC26]|nr:hypothetical protein N410_08495 [Helicobacter pylori GC26]